MGPGNGVPGNGVSPYAMHQMSPHDGGMMFQQGAHGMIYPQAYMQSPKYVAVFLVLFCYFGLFLRALGSFRWTLGTARWVCLGRGASVFVRVEHLQKAFVDLLVRCGIGVQCHDSSFALMVYIWVAKLCMRHGCFALLFVGVIQFRKHAGERGGIPWRQSRAGSPGPVPRYRQSSVLLV